MNLFEVIAALKLIDIKINAKGYYMPKAMLFTNWCGYDLTINIEYRTSHGVSTKNGFVHGRIDDGDTIESLLVKANEFADNLTSIEDAQKNDFIKAVGKLIDQGREIGINVDYLNPLTEMMGKLSKNIITHQE